MSVGGSIFGRCNGVMHGGINVLARFRVGVWSIISLLVFLYSEISWKRAFTCRTAHDIAAPCTCVCTTDEMRHDVQYE